MSKRMCLFLVSFATVILMAIPVKAISTYSDMMNIGLSYTGTTANCSLDVIADKSTQRISATLRLYQGNIQVASWQASSIGLLTMQKTRQVTKGKTYKLVADITIAGQKKPAISITRTC